MHEVDRSTCIEAAHSDRATARSGPRVAQSCRASLSIVRHSSARSRRGGRGTTRRASRRARPRRPSSAASSPRPRPSRVIATDLTSPSPSPASPLPRHRLTMIRRPPRPRHGHATTRSSQPPSSSPHHLVEHGGREQHDGRPEAGRVALLAGLLELDARVRKGVRRAVAHRRAQPEQACRRPRRASGHHRADAPRAREERRSGRGGVGGGGDFRCWAVAECCVRRGGAVACGARCGGPLVCYLFILPFGFHTPFSASRCAIGQLRRAQFLP